MALHIDMSNFSENLYVDKGTCEEAWLKLRTTELCVIIKGTWDLLQKHLSQNALWT